MPARKKAHSQWKSECEKKSDRATCVIMKAVFWLKICALRAECVTLSLDLSEYKMEDDNKIIEDIASQEYKYGFTTDIHTDTLPRGLDEGIVRSISSIKGEPQWMTDYRLRAYRHWKTLTPPTWAHLDIPDIDFQDIIYYAAPKTRTDGPKSIDEIDPELKATFDRLGIPLEEQLALSGVAVMR